VIDEAELRRMTAQERRELIHTLARYELPHPLLERSQMRRRRLGLVFMSAVCIFLAAWIAYLVLSLPNKFTSHDWTTVWVGLDIVELAAFAVTAWAAWRQRQIVIVLMLVTGTLLLCDAWFDLALNYGTPGFTMSVISADCAEIPLALLLFAAARRLIRLTVHSVMRLQGVDGRLPPLRQMPLFADGMEEALHPRLRQSVTTTDAISSSSHGP
jgi:hypothetical protein